MKSSSNTINETKVPVYTKITYDLGDPMTISEDYPRQFYYMKKWKYIPSDLTLEAPYLGDNRMNMYVFFSRDSFDNLPGEPFDPDMYNSTKYEFGIPGHPNVFVMNNIPPANDNETEAYINVVAERVNCTTCDHYIILVMDIPESVGYTVAGILGFVVLFFASLVIVGLLTCKC
jgi:hypothetical protein